jgi:hypothetical protein
LPRQLDFAGQSGTVYRYTLLDEEEPPPPRGANYVIAKVEGRSAEVVFAGETDDLSTGEWRRRFADAQKRYGATDILVRLNVRAAVRRAERDDLVGAHHPPMNGGPPRGPPEEGA